MAGSGRPWRATLAGEGWEGQGQGQGQGDAQGLGPLGAAGALAWKNLSKVLQFFQRG